MHSGVIIHKMSLSSIRIDIRKVVIHLLAQYWGLRNQSVTLVVMCQDKRSRRASGLGVLSKLPQINLALASASEGLLGLGIVVLPDGVVRDEEGCAQKVSHTQM